MPRVLKKAIQLPKSLWNRLTEKLHQFELEARAAAEAASSATQTSTNDTGMTVEEEENMRKELLLKHMNKYTRALKESDFHDDSSSSDNDCSCIILDDESKHRNHVVGFSLSDMTVYAEKLKPEERGGICVPNECAICISEFDVGDNVTFSGNKKCPHVFHQECILNWMLKKTTMSTRSNDNSPNTISAASGSNSSILNSAAAKCPCCRRTFVVNSNKEKKNLHMTLPSDSSEDKGLNTALVTTSSINEPLSSR